MLASIGDMPPVARPSIRVKLKDRMLSSVSNKDNDANNSATSVLAGKRLKRGRTKAIANKTNYSRKTITRLSS